MRAERAFGLSPAWIICAGIVAWLAFGSGGPPAGNATPPDDAIAGKIDRLVLQDTANDRVASFLVVMDGQADLSAAYAIRNQDARGWFVYRTLSTYAERSQASLRSYLDGHGIGYHSFWVVNAVVVTGSRSLVEQLAARQDVGRIEPNHSYRAIEDPGVVDLQGVNGVQGALSGDAPRTVEWGVHNVRADDVWAMGYTGQGIVIGVQDTGMRWTHNALKPHYRGWNGNTADHDYNWWDAIHSGGDTCGANSQQPCDDNGHGTSVTGVIVGDDGAGNQIGVAPGAKWIGCRSLDQGAGTPETFAECFQFFIAPTDLNGQNPDPTKRPDIVNNSWVCPPALGCSPDTLRQILENCQAAGIFVGTSVDAGGPVCSSIQNPPGIYEAAFSTGAMDIDNTLASFSGRGPVTVDGSNRLKPNITAPGVQIRSSYNTSDNAYTIQSGTSFASPHVMGAVALLWSARPELARDVATSKTILQNSANPDVLVSAGPPYCGGTPPNQIPNNYFGYGRVDALAAVNYQRSQTPTATPQYATATPTSTVTSVAPTGTGTPAGTVVSTATSSATGIATVGTSVAPSASATPVAPSASATPVPPTPCALSFNDVPQSDPYYTFVRCLACRGIVSGYNDETFRPGNNVTRGQLSKMVANAAGIDDPVPSAKQTFRDVPRSNTFWLWIERLAGRGYIGGYEDGTFRPQNNATRGQLSKIGSNTAGFEDTIPAGRQTYIDVPPSDEFWIYIERLSWRDIVTGYADNTFRPGDSATRGQTSKITANTFLPDCRTPARP